MRGRSPMIAHAALVVSAACGDNRAAPGLPIDAALDALDAPRADARPPDLTLIAAQMDGTAEVVSQPFAGDACEVVEGCVGGVGVRKLLRFDTVTANIGGSDVVIGAAPAPGVDRPPFQWSPCHNHHHLTGYALYELLDSTGVVLSGHKQAFCLQDLAPIVPGAPSHGYNCANQGLSAGWADAYTRVLPCQWIDVTDVPPGTYTLRVRVNPSQTFPDGDPSNNEYRTSVTI